MAWTLGTVAAGSKIVRFSDPDDRAHNPHRVLLVEEQDGTSYWICFDGQTGSKEYMTIQRPGCAGHLAEG